MIALLDRMSLRSLTIVLMFSSLITASPGCTNGVLPKPTSTQPPAPIDFSLALQYAQRAALVYESDAAIKQNSPVGTMVAFMAESPKGVKALIETNETNKIQRIVVRGTSSLDKVKLDMDYTTVVGGRLQIPLRKEFAGTALQVSAFAKPLLRFVNDKDPVPLLPPLDFTTIPDEGPHQHIGPEVVLKDGTTYACFSNTQAERVSVISF